MEPARRDRVLLAAVVFAVLFAQVLLYPGVPDLVAALGATTGALDAGTWFLGVEFAAFVLAAGLWGAASDAAGRRVPFILAGALGGAAGYLALALSPALGDPSFALVLVLRALQGAATIGAFSLAMTMLMDLPSGHGRNMGAAGIAIGLGTATGAPVGGRLTTVDPLLPLFAAAAVLLVAAGLVSRVRDRSPDPDRAGVADGLARLTDRPALGIPFAFGFIDRLSAGFFALVGTLYFRTAFGLDAAATGLVLALFFAPFALLQYPFGVLSDRIGRTAPVVAGSALYGVALVGVGLAPSLELAGGLLVVVGVLGALMAPATMALVTDLAAPEERGAAMGGFNTFGSIGFFAGVVVGGAVAGQFGFLAAFLVVGALEVALAAVALPLLLRLEVDVEATFGRRGAAGDEGT
ncbi:MAG: MFS transporter [Halobacteriales archaeon]|nr:MFS transporter [Halobacteriales archaeon]